MAETVLAVCTGNICRSPFVERMLAAWVPGGAVGFASAGVRAVVGAPMEPLAAAQLVAWHGNPAGFVARQATEPLIAEAALIIALTRAHRTWVVQCHPAALSRTFTLRELGRLLPDAAPRLAPTSPGERISAALPVLREVRGAQVGAAPDDDDIADPYGGGVEAYARAVREMVGPLDRIASWLNGRSAGAG